MDGHSRVQIREANNTIGNDDLLNKNYTLAYEHKNDL